MKNTFVIVLGYALVSGCDKRPDVIAPALNAPEKEGEAAKLPPRCETTDRAPPNLALPTPPHLAGIPHVDPRLKIKPEPIPLANPAVPVVTDKMVRAQQAYLERAEQLKRVYPNPAEYENARAVIKDQMLRER